MRHSDILSRFRRREPPLDRRVRGVVLSICSAVGVASVWWGVDRVSELDGLPEAAEPTVEVGHPQTATAADPGGFPPEATGTAAFMEFAAEVQRTAGERGPTGPRGGSEEIATSPAWGETPRSRGGSGAEPLASSDAVEYDAENAAYLEEAGRRARRFGRLENAAESFELALAIREQTLAPDDPSIAHTLRQLGDVYADQKRYIEAETAYKRALAINEEAYGDTSVLAAAALSDLALLYRRQGRSLEALPLLEAALDIELDVWGPQHPNVAARLAALGLLYRQQGRYYEAEPYLVQALLVREQVYRPDAPETTGALTSLAHLYRHQERYAEAEDLFRRALAIHEGMSDLPRVALDLANLSVLYLSDARFAEAQPVFERALRIEDENQWSVTPQVSVGLDQLARAADAQGRHDEAEEIYQWAFDASYRVLGGESANSAFLRSQYIRYLRSLGRDQEADRLDKS
jgi:tetratricopeptide (TPR) repeat protein